MGCSLICGKSGSGSVRESCWLSPALLTHEYDWRIACGTNCPTSSRRYVSNFFSCTHTSSIIRLTTARSVSFENSAWANVQGKPWRSRIAATSSACTSGVSNLVWMHARIFRACRALSSHKHHPRRNVRYPRM
eukprot:scaffold57959_cov69-Phaeocystis_antarctica.AAC.6